MFSFDSKLISEYMPLPQSYLEAGKKLLVSGAGLLTGHVICKILDPLPLTLRIAIYATSIFLFHILFSSHTKRQKPPFRNVTISVQTDIKLFHEQAKQFYNVTLDIKDVNTSFNIAKVKALIAEELPEYAIDRQIIMYAGERIEDRKVLQDFLIQSSDLIETRFIVRLRA